MTHAMLVIALVLGVVFAHGGACAAVELAEAASYGADAGRLPAGPGSHGADLERLPADPAVHGIGCRHSSLPEHHRHGTEQDCSAGAPAGSPHLTVLLTAIAAAPRAGAAAVPHGSGAGVPLAAPHLRNLCVLRI
ncbi:hypothetical protein SAMN05421874_14027 [Nonomuraea maritima]|uniref:Uncharacterized protein n=2 Tax=Nonomuraea maritima TaxID=683260 RepID=A0A1G9QRE3_9ACTN|nr:hypothetical protein SAMN05421874_14027 [Nonomuraea maritima]